MKWVLFAHPSRDDVHLRRRSTTYLRASGRTQDGINQEKNLTSTVKEDMSDLSSLIHRRWNDCFDSGRLLKKQLSDAGRVIKRRKARANKEKRYREREWGRESEKGREMGQKERGRGF